MSFETDIVAELHKLQVRASPVFSAEVPLFETGTYVPTYLGGTTAGVTTYSVQQGAWTKIGNLVFVTATVQWTAATGTGNAQVSLPFTSANVANQNHSGSLWQATVTFANGTPQLLISPNTAFFIMTSPLTNAANTTVAMEAAGVIVFSAAYRYA
jgi:hypothetical protein